MFSRLDLTFSSQRCQPQCNALTHATTRLPDELTKASRFLRSATLLRMLRPCFLAAMALSEDDRMSRVNRVAWGISHSRTCNTPLWLHTVDCRRAQHQIGAIGGRVGPSCFAWGRSNDRTSVMASLLPFRSSTSTARVCEEGSPVIILHSSPKSLFSIPPFLNPRTMSDTEVIVPPNPADGPISAMYTLIPSDNVPLYVKAERFARIL